VGLGPFKHLCGRLLTVQAAVSVLFFACSQATAQLVGNLSFGTKPNHVRLAGGL
jgi:hypothetical protein